MFAVVVFTLCFMGVKKGPKAYLSLAPTVMSGRPFVYKRIILFDSQIMRMVWGIMVLSYKDWVNGVIEEL